MRQALWPLLLLFASLPLLGAAQCSAADRDLLIDFAKTWAQDKGIVDKDGKPTFDAIARAGFGSSTGDSEADAAIDAGIVARNIKEADDVADKGRKALREGNDKAANEDLDKAVTLRPGDWSYRNQRAAIQIKMFGSYMPALNDLKEAESLACGDPAKPKPNTCRRMYEDRTRVLDESIKLEPSHAKPYCRLYAEQADAYSNLMRLAPTDQAREQYRELRDDAQRRANPAVDSCMEA